ncbi:hypothetical protein FNV43_RR16952 [Rhamnella rubrinervis]|uniref:Uncharacterized protein n=1 Tax=Rhamnella rubrinervis TaxID=2594499 RepID=A0A8K0ME39_9ROSA|nr:hypothetical protein FNV43_RR16952 [Rhamnella rubrinervis]
MRQRLTIYLQFYQVTTMVAEKWWPNWVSQIHCDQGVFKLNEGWNRVQGILWTIGKCVLWLVLLIGDDGKLLRRYGGVIAKKGGETVKVRGKEREERWGKKKE